MIVRTFIVKAGHLESGSLGYKSVIKNILAFEFYDAFDGDRMCRLVCEVKK